MPCRPLIVASALVVVAAGLGTATGAQAPPFELQTGPPAAAMPDPQAPGVKKLKDVTFVVRARGCAAETFRVTATAEWRDGGSRRSVDITPVALPQAGVFAITSPGPGVPVVAVRGTCGAAAAGALVRLTQGRYWREGVALLSHHPSPADIDRALDGATGGRR